MATFCVINRSHEHALAAYLISDKGLLRPAQIWNCATTFQQT